MSYSFVQELNNENSEKYKIFISHASIDKKLVTAFVELLEGIGVDPEQIFLVRLRNMEFRLEQIFMNICEMSFLEIRYM